MRAARGAHTVSADRESCFKGNYQRSELDWLIYNDPLGYVDLIFNGDLKEYLKTVRDLRKFCVIDEIRQYER